MAVRNLLAYNCISKYYVSLWKHLIVSFFKWPSRMLTKSIEKAIMHSLLCSHEIVSYSYWTLYIHPHILYQVTCSYICAVQYLCISSNTCKSALPDIYAQHSRAHNTLGRAVTKGEYVYIRWSKSACVVTNMLHFWHSKIHLNLKLIAQLACMWLDLWKLSLTAQEIKSSLLLIIKPTLLCYIETPSK